MNLDITWEDDIINKYKKTVDLLDLYDENLIKEDTIEEVLLDLVEDGDISFSSEEFVKILDELIYKLINYDHYKSF